MFSIGYFISFFDWLLPESPFGFFSVQNILIFVVGMIIMCLGIAMYIESELGLVPYDSFSLILTEKIGGSYSVVRTIMDGVVSIIAFVLGGPISLGTIILTVGLGSMIDYFRGRVKVVI